MRAVIAIFAIVALAGIDNVALVFVAREVLDAGPGGYGLLVAAFGAGMLAASAALAAWRRDLDAVNLSVAAIALSGVGNAVTGLAPNLPVAAVRTRGRRGQRDSERRC